MAAQRGYPDSGSTQTEVTPLAEESLTNLLERDARLKLCSGRLLLRIRMASDEVSSLKEPAPLFSLAPRLSYLPFLFNDVYEHFEASLPPKFGQPSYDIWFDYDGVPLKWQYPVGVLSDMLVGVDVPTPLDLTVHFRCCPTGKITQFRGIADLQRTFMNTFRQAIFMQRGSAAAWGRLSKTAQTQLWDSISRSNVEGDYLEVQRQLISKTLGQCHSLAIRLHLCSPNNYEVLLRPAPAQDGERPRTLQTHLAELMPPLFDSKTGTLADGVSILTLGVEVPLDTPLYWLALHAAYLDQFVHVVARVPGHLFEGRAGSVEDPA